MDKKTYKQNLKCPACDSHQVRYIKTKKILCCRKCGCEWRHDPMEI